MKPTLQPRWWLFLVASRNIYVIGGRVGSFFQDTRARERRSLDRGSVRAREFTSGADVAEKGVWATNPAMKTRALFECCKHPHDPGNILQVATSVICTQNRRVPSIAENNSKRSLPLRLRSGWRSLLYRWLSDSVRARNKEQRNGEMEAILRQFYSGGDETLSALQCESAAPDDLDIPILIGDN